MPILPQHIVGEPFNPWRKICGFYPPDIVGRNTHLKLTDGQKRLYERSCRWAGRNGEFRYGFRTIAEALGKSVRQVKDDMATLEEKGLMAHTRRGPLVNRYRFLWHPIFEVQPTAHQEGDLEVQDSTLEVQDSVKKGPLEVQPTAHRLCPSMNYVHRISSSSASSGENVAQPDDDDGPSKKTSQHPDPEAVAEFQQMLRMSRAQTLGVPLKQVPAADRKITIQILEEFADFEDAKKWIEDTIRRGLASKSRDSRWGLYLADARNHGEAIALMPSTPATARKPPECQTSQERLEALWAKRLAKGERPT